MRPDSNHRQPGSLELHIQAARTMRDQGASLSQIANALGVSPPTVHRWTTPGGIEQDRERARRWKARNPERNAEIMRAYRRGGTCELCGAQAMRKSRRCRACVHSLAETRASILEGLWADDWPGTEIAATFGVTTSAIFFEIDRLRKQGRAPYRYAGAAAKASA